jgi:hypothetical protein
MNENNTQQGIGLVAVIAIVAVIGIGGVAAAQMYSSNQAAVAVDEAEMQSEAEQAVAAVKADIKSSLLSLRTEVQGDLSTNVSAALTLIDGLRADVAAISAEGNAELQAELNQMDASLAELETQLESESAEEALMLACRLPMKRMACSQVTLPMKKVRKWKNQKPHQKLKSM